ncbi:uncharacterized protein LOC116431100 [Nomia melanderi]|uniref:uncharacterized protein LOC116431100 n=1 Tax=Nomia melanderi TaxID=2448451 RepID=UPI00130461B4|nr:uncharacterized protein LOC116431100 isoform X2 [Nomia melanderi]XP_031841924.1 uncharacterized protein LOC116431100 isoform X2 [Nomia melanderi]XP_031841925.1 uncharacterized protein LOC116431100 isoform X2 [Nomia melanderi]XP_031841926.1 uncharacterized protein LOC116431100 isoform X2 [Nomia melanderi]XP_031841927.1 uncharacterized protein LOC116431100 isoform X2 [Nomia melanderi]XP_031841928.1 uncharacterized protein LOC116431100 isoform X2 [Nomia melanderi]XP_031841930.1 uncharacterize
MFCLKGRGNRDAKLKETLNVDDCGWWLCNEDELKSPRSSRSKDCLSLDSASESMLSCIDSDDDESYSLAQEFRPELNDNCEKIELTSLIHEDLNVDLIERDAIRNEPDVTAFPAKEAKDYFEESEPKSQRSRGICYTPERLVRSQEYRILTPSSRYLSISQARLMPENENPRKALRCRRRLNYLIDSKQVGSTQLRVLLNSTPVEIAVPAIFSPPWKNCRKNFNDDVSSEYDDDGTKTDHPLNTMDHKKPIDLQTPDSIYKRSSNEGLNVTWEDCKRIETRSSSMDDTSGIQSNDWSSDTYSDLQNTPLCLSDELASTNYKLDTSQGRCTAINEVVSILEVLDTDPEKAAVLLEEDRFCDSTSSHDQLTRLALAIETDAKVPDVLETSENVVRNLQRRVEKLQAGSKDMFKDICNLRQSFQCDERKMEDLSNNTSKLREDIHEMRYLDDILNLLRGELKRISKRNWPFVAGRTEHHSEEMNLIV